MKFTGRMMYNGKLWLKMTPEERAAAWEHLTREEKGQATREEMAQYYGVTPESLNAPEEKRREWRQQILSYREREKREKEQRKQAERP